MTLLLLVVGCGQPHHLQYDHGRAYQAVFVMQTDLERPSIAGSVYEISGREGLLLRENVETETAREKSGKLEKVDDE